MAATAQIAHPLAAQTHKRPAVICHVTVAHSQLKSRSFHRQLLPLSGLGYEVRYLAPIQQSDLNSSVQFINLPSRRGFLLRLTWWPRLLRQLRRQRAGLYHFQDPQLLPLAFVLKLIFRKRVVYDAYEDFPSIAAAKESIPKIVRPVAAATVAFAERLAARIFDAVVTADPITMRRFGRTGPSKKLVFYNFPNLNFFPAPHPRRAPFDLIYRGGLSSRTGTFVLLDALQLLAVKRRSPRLLLIGYFDNPAAEKAMRDCISRLGLDPFVEIRCRIDHEEMAGALDEARIGLSPLLAVPKFQKNIPVKIFEYWACGLPAVATDLAPMRPFFRHGDAGLLVQPGSATELAAAIEWLLDNPDSASRMGRRGRQLITQRFNNSGEVHKLRRIFERIASHSEGGRAAPCSNLS
ncbi:MAG: glycosyltransferase family 4 protein [Candidatus Acidiferrales bacterium]